jgi:hypothetical protein
VGSRGGATTNLQRPSPWPPWTFSGVCRLHITVALASLPTAEGGAPPEDGYAASSTVGHPIVTVCGSRQPASLPRSRSATENE